MTHAASRRRRLPGDKRNHRLLHMLFYIGSRGLFRVAANFADHNDRVRFLIFIEQFQRVDKVCPDDRISADPDRRRLANAALRQLEHGFVRQRARARHNADVSFFMNMSGHNADLGFAGRNDSRTIRPNQSRLAFDLQVFIRPNHIQNRNAFRDANDQRHFGIDGFQQRVGRELRRNKNNRGVGAGLFFGFRHCIKDRPAFMRGAAFARRHAANNVGAVSRAGLGVERAFSSGNSLDDQPRGFIYKNRHYRPPAAATTFSAASFIVSATWKFRPEFFRISRPCSTLVPSSRSTSGNFRFVAFAAWTTPSASVSTRRMPPKILIRIAFTFLSLSRISNAWPICSAFAPPPTSKKFAGDPPAYLMMSMVAMASPAPFTRQAMLPSSLM